MTAPAPKCPVCRSPLSAVPNADANAKPVLFCKPCQQAEAAWAKTNTPLIPSNVAVLLSEDDFESPQMAVRRVRCDVCNRPAIRVTLPTASGLIAVVQPHDTGSHPPRCEGHVVEATPDASIR